MCYLTYDYISLRVTMMVTEKDGDVRNEEQLIGVLQLIYSSVNWAIVASGNGF